MYSRRREEKDRDELHGGCKGLRSCLVWIDREKLKFFGSENVLKMSVVEKN